MFSIIIYCCHFYYYRSSYFILFGLLLFFYYSIRPRHKPKVVPEPKAHFICLQARQLGPRFNKPKPSPMPSFFSSHQLPVSFMTSPSPAWLLMHATCLQLPTTTNSGLPCNHLSSPAVPRPHKKAMKLAMLLKTPYRPLVRATFHAKAHAWGYLLCCPR